MATDQELQELDRWIKDMRTRLIKLDELINYAIQKHPTYTQEETNERDKKF